MNVVEPDQIEALDVRNGAGDPMIHEVIWTPDRIQRFWDFISSNKAMEDNYFSKMRGRSLIEFVSRRIRIGTALDMGCGRGDLIAYLLDDYEVCGADQSPDSVEFVRARFGGHPRFRGVSEGTRHIGDAAVDTVFLVEVIEHLDDETLESVLTEARRLLKPDGHLVLTTPNDEDMTANKIVCPECGCLFHRWQHVRSWTTNSVAEHVARLGFEGRATATLLSHRQGPEKIMRLLLHRLRRHPDPHMVYIGSPVRYRGGAIQ